MVALIAGIVVWAAGVFGVYGWFTDELYFLACARRPALGYVDHPPLATLLLGVLRFVTQDNMALIRLVAGGSAVIVIAGFYSMNPFELLLAIVLAQVALALTRGASPRAWLVFGGVTGLALLNKHSALLPVGLLAAATLASPARTHLRTRWVYLGVALALVIAAPNLVWLVVNDGVTFEFYRVSVPLKNVEQSPLGSIAGQALFVGPIAFVIAVVGAVALVRQPSRRGFAAMFVVALAVMVTGGISRADRILAVYPLLVAAGACALGALPPLPLVLPVFPPSFVPRYSEAIALTTARCLPMISGALSSSARITVSQVRSSSTALMRVFRGRSSRRTTRSGRGGQARSAMPSCSPSATTLPTGMACTPRSSRWAPFTARRVSSMGR